MLRKVLTGLNLSISLVIYCQTGGHSAHLVEVTGSRITIEGSTNVTTFSCGLVETKSFEPLTVLSQWSDLDIHFEKLIIPFPIEKFDCGLDLMTQDFRSLLKYKEHPDLIFQVNQIRINPSSPGFELLSVEADVLVSIGGIKRQYWIRDATVINKTEEDLTLKGEKVIRMTDFDIDPPVKFFGTVKVNADLNVSFSVDLHVKTIKKGGG